MLRQYQLDTALIILLALAGTTLLASWHLAAGPFANAIVLGLAALKGQRIVLDFLGLREAPSLWRGIVTAWILGMASFAWAASAISLLI